VVGHTQVNSRISKGIQNILIYNFIITTFYCQGNSQDGGISAKAFALVPLPIIDIDRSPRGM